MIKFVVATSNNGKLKEIKDFFKDQAIEFISMAQMGIDIDIKENGNTFEQNALIKAKAVAQYTHLPVIADDSGLEVEYLNNQPGIYSARFSGKNSTDLQNIQKLLKLMEHVKWKDRKARFKCVIAVYFNPQDILTVAGECNGFISEKPLGQNGFGYDPVFFVPQYNKTFAQLPSNIKNAISHRADALGKLKDILLNRLNL